MSFMEHLEELRIRLIVCAVYLFLGCLVGFALARPTITLLLRPFKSVEMSAKERVLKVRIDADGVWRFDGPLDRESLKNDPPRGFAFYLPAHAKGDESPDFVWSGTASSPVFFSPLDPVWLYFTASTIIGFILAFPLMLHQLWLFVAPGLLPREKRAMIPILLLAMVMFPVGAGFAYFMFGRILDFLLNFRVVDMIPQIEVFQFVGLEIRMMVAFGTIFELPLIVMFLTLLGVLHPKQLRRWRPYAIVVMSIAAAAFTPPDVASMLIMLIPLIILYEVSIWVSLPLARKRAEE
jgi:sec-independent protein translocase protein TatC